MKRTFLSSELKAEYKSFAIDWSFCLQKPFPSKYEWKKEEQKFVLLKYSKPTNEFDCKLLESKLFGGVMVYLYNTIYVTL